MAAVNKKVQLSKANDDIEEVDFAAMLEESFKKTEEDSDGIIVDIKDSEVFVNVGKKSEGILDISEIQDENGEIKFKVGDTIKVVITGSRGGKPIVSHKKALRKEKVKAYIDSYNEENQDVFDVKIIGKNKGGFVAQNSDGVEFFLPRSQGGFKDANAVVGKSFKVKVIKIDKDEQSIIVSRKKLLDEEGDKVLVKVIKYDNEKKHLSLSIKAATPDPWEEIKDGLEVGDTIKVTVSNIEPYGAFVDLGNDIEGFLHISEISWDKNIKNPKDHISEGEELDVEVIEIDANDRRLRVSLKNLLKKPFDEFKAKFKEGDVTKGVVTSVTNFGAFVRIGAVEGLLHNEDASWDRNDKCKDLFKIGDEIEVKIIKIDANEQKISLSQKDLKQSPVQAYAKKFNVGDIVTGKIRDIKDFGVFVELGDNVDALIRKEDLGNVSAESLNINDNIEAAIAFIDEKKNRIRLSIRRLARQKEREVLNEINSDDKVTLGDIIKEQLS